METVSIKCDKMSHGDNRPSVGFPYPTSAISTNLRVLEIKNAGISPAAFEELFAFPELSNVKELKISGVFIGYEGLWNADHDL